MILTLVIVAVALYWIIAGRCMMKYDYYNGEFEKEHTRSGIFVLLLLDFTLGPIFFVVLFPDVLGTIRRKRGKPAKEIKMLKYAIALACGDLRGYRERKKANHES